MKKTIQFTDIKIEKDGVSFTILIMMGQILLSKSKRYFVKFSRDVKIYNSTFIDAIQFILKSWVNRKVIKNYNIVFDIKPDVDIAKTRANYSNYILMDSLGLDSNAVGMLLDGQTEYTALTMTNYKANAQVGLVQSHFPAISAEISLPQTIDNEIRFNIDHNFNFQIAALFLIDDLSACTMFNGSVDEYKTPEYKFGTNFKICTSTFINGSLASMMMNMKLDTDNFWNRFIDCGGAMPHFKDFKKLMMALYADQALALNYMTDERIAQYIQHRQINLDKWETASYVYDREFKKITPRIPSDVIVPLLNIDKQFISKFFQRAEDRQQIDAIYALLDKQEYADTVQACRAPFSIFNKEELSRAFENDQTAAANILAKMNQIETQLIGA